MTISTQIVNNQNGIANFVVDEGAKLRFKVFDYTQAAVSPGSTTTLSFQDLPSGRVRILPNFCRFSVTALGAARVLNIGLGAYTAVDGTTVAAVTNNIASAIDVSAATITTPATTAGAAPFVDALARSAPRVLGTVTGGTIPAGAVFRGIIAYLID